MSQPYATLHKREAGYPTTNADALDILWKALVNVAKRSWNRLRALAPKNVHARIILMAEAYVAAQGYLLWPSNANMLPVNRDNNDGFRYLDL